MALRELAELPCLGLSLDYFFEMQPRAQQTDSWPNYEALCRGYHRTLTAWAREGFFVIGETVLETETALLDAAQTLGPVEALFVKVHCPVEDLERRELARGDRPVGRARFQSEFIHSHGAYDIEVDTSKMSADTAAKFIWDQITSTEAKAFKRLAAEQSIQLHVGRIG